MALSRLPRVLVSGHRLLSRRPTPHHRQFTTTTTTLQQQQHAQPQPALNRLLRISPEVTTALSRNQPVVALESTIYTHGALGNDLRLEEIVRAHGAVPAVCGVLAGVPTVGLTPEEVARMVAAVGVRKVSRRDLAYIAGRGLLGNNDGTSGLLHGGTTIAGTMVLARLAGIRVFGTGGLGGVHRGGESSMDVSADLTELGRTRVAVVSSGCKGFLDIPRTLEFLETHGVMVATFADGRSVEGAGVDFPAFWARESGTRSPFVVTDEREAAAMILAQEQLGIETGLLFANPIPEEHAIPREDMEAAIETAVREAGEKGFTGSANTPYILSRIRKLTQGRSVPANKALVQANVARAAKIAVELAKMMDGSPVTVKTAAADVLEIQTEDCRVVDVLVAGSVALDWNCNYVGGGAAAGAGDDAVSPRLHTSNPASINQSVGGVGRNIALAAHNVSEEGQVRLCSMVGNDSAGSMILSNLRASGLDTSCVRQLGPEHPWARTAQYVAINDKRNDLVLAMADMDIFSKDSFPEYWNSVVAATKPKWLVVDANWAEADIQAWIRAGRKHGAMIAFEPVSEAKSQRLFPPLGAPRTGLGIYPDPIADICTPNQYELLAMGRAARLNGYFDRPTWSEMVAVLGSSMDMNSRTRALFPNMALDHADAFGIPKQALDLLPYIPTIVTKLGAQGALLTALLTRDDPRLADPSEAEYVVDVRGKGHPLVGGVYMRWFPAVEDVVVPVSVNGSGDTFMGVLVAGLAMGGKVERLVNVAQEAAVMTLMSAESVSDKVKTLKGRLRRAAGMSWVVTARL